MPVEKHSIQTIYSDLSLTFSRYDVQHSSTETLDTDNIFGPLSLSLVMTYYMHVKRHSILTINAGLSLSRYYVTKCMYINIRYWQYIEASLSLSLVMTYNIMYRKTRYWQYIRASLSFSLVMTYNMHVQKHSILTIYSGLSLSRYYVQHACTETPDTDNIFGPLSLSVSLRRTTFMYQSPRYWQYIRASLSLSLWRTICMYRNSRYWQYIWLSLSLWRTTCMYRNTQHWQYIRGSLSLSLWRTTCIYRNTRYWQYIRASLPLSRYDVHMHVQKYSTLTIYSGLSLSFSLSFWRTTCMYRTTQHWQYIRASLSLFLSLVMTYNMHVQKHSILTIHSGLSLPLSRYDIQHACTETLNTDSYLARALSLFCVAVRYIARAHTGLSPPLS